MRRVGRIRWTTRASHPWFIAFVLCLVSSTRVDAQWVATQSFTARDGLAQSQVTDLAQDMHGFLWIATQGGISRFDGKRFMTLTAEQGLPDDVVSALATDPVRRVVWLGTDSGALAFWDGRRLHTVENRPDRLCSRITALHTGPDATLLVGTEDGLWMLSKDHFVPLLMQPVAAIFEGLDTQLWVLTGHRSEASQTYRSRIEPASLVRLNAAGTPLEVKIDLGPEPIIAWASRSGTVWLARGDGEILKLDATGSSLVHGPPAEEVLSLLPGREGDLWIGTNLGLWRRRPDGSLERTRFDPALSGIPVSALYEDHEGNLWIGTWTQGLFRHAPGSATLFTTESGLPAPTVWALAEDDHGCVLMGTDYGGLARWCSDGWHQPLRKADGLPSDRVMSLLVAHDGGLWIGTDAGLARRDPDGGVTTWTTDQGLPNSYVRVIAQDSQGRIWAGTTAGLARFDGSWESWTQRHCLPADPIRGLAFDRSGDLWLATDSYGVLVFDGSTFEPFTTVDGLPNDRVWTITVDSRDRVWAGTDSGIWVHPQDGSGDIVLGADSGLPRMNVLFLVEDTQGHMWAGTTQGIARIDPTGHVVSSFAAPDGFTDGEANENAALLDREGMLWFGLARGVTRLDPRRLLRNRVPPPIALDRVLVNGEELELDVPISSATGPRQAELVLGPSVSELRLEYCALSFMEPEKVRYRVQLVGFDPEPSAPTDEQHVTYRNVPPGSYSFTLDASNNHDVWSKPLEALEIRVRPRWYQTIWFRASLSIGAILLGLAWFRSRLKAERRLQRRLEEEVTARTAELQQANARIREQNLQLADLSRTDPLTRLGNRRVLAEQLPTEMAVLRRELVRMRPLDLSYHHGAAIMMIDLDHFKEINDRWGHDAGDRLLQAIAAALLETLREIDLAIRWGGEEIVVLTRGIDGTGARHLAQRLLRKIEEVSVPGPHDEPIRVTASAGLIRYPLALNHQLPNQRWHELLEAADRLLYLAKQRGRARALGLLWPPGPTAPCSETEVLRQILEDPANLDCGLELVEIKSTDEPAS